MNEHFGRWKLLEPLARGGMGETWLAQARGGRVAVIKRVRPSSSSALLLERFEIERRALARLRVRGVPELLAAGEIGGVPYCALEHVEGVALDAFLRAKHASSDETFACLLRCVELVGEVHAQGVVHGDLKPASFLVGLGREPHLIDFGLAWIAGDPPRSGADAKLMTPRYGAPEQFLGRPISPATDVYALGLMALDLLRGLTCEREAAFEELERAALGSRPPPSTPCGPDLDEVLARALLVEPGERWANAGALAASMKAALGG